MTAPECPVCRVNIEEGHALEQDSNGRLARIRWTEGLLWSASDTSS
ncbi:MAG: hypothetical protein NTU62_10610 [Spirochaetes bacterium]|jgi:hypothetical protein|nr:hypothetical protein [Spirochaetota bacterium]